jgi:serpin B
MERRLFLALLALPAVTRLLAACGERQSASPDTQQRASLQGTAKRITTGADPATATAAVNAFAADMYERLTAAEPNVNIVFSPASIALALAMTSSGARGATLTEMDQVLHIADPAGIHRSMNALSAAFDACTKSKDLAAEGGTGTANVKVAITNSLWGQAGLTFEPSFLDLLSAEYGAGMETVDYASDPEAARATINQWVADQTEQRINELLAKGIISRDTLLTLVNAVYLKATWATQFYVAATTPATFTTGDGRSVNVDMMHTGGTLLFAHGPGWKAVELDYAFGDLGFVVAMGDDATSSMPQAAAVFSTLAPTLVTLGLPKFDIGAAIQLGDMLKAMGMPTAFAESADFSGITAQADLLISDVVHQANITVDEHGTEAAAATAVVGMATSAPIDPPIPFEVDRPFTFWLREKTTGAILFMGRVADPAA